MTTSQCSVHFKWGGCIFFPSVKSMHSYLVPIVRPMKMSILRTRISFRFSENDWRLLPVRFLFGLFTYLQLFSTCLTAWVMPGFDSLWACICVACVSGSLAAGRWTAWPWRDRRTMAFPCRWTQSSYKPLGNWAGGPVSAPSLTTLSGNTGPISCSLPHWEVNNLDRLCFQVIVLVKMDMDTNTSFGKIFVTTFSSKNNDKPIRQVLYFCRIISRIASEVWGRTTGCRHWDF